MKRRNVRWLSRDSEDGLTVMHTMFSLPVAFQGNVSNDRDVMDLLFFPQGIGVNADDYEDFLRKDRTLIN